MSANVRAVEELLRQFHDTPIPTEQTKDRELALIYDYLVDIPPHADGSLHWFCEEATVVTREAATFLLRLFAYGTEKALQWRALLFKCTSTCCNCVIALEERKWSSRDTYFAIFPKRVLLEFYDAMGKWEAQEILKALASAGVEDLSQPLSLAPPAITYQIVCNVRVLQDRRILSILKSCAPSSPITEWPTDTIPPGLFVLFINDSMEVRKWAMMQSERCQHVPLPQDKFSYAHAQILEHIINIVDGTMISSPFSISPDHDVQWLGLKLAIRRSPARVLVAGSDIKADVRKLASGHIQDQGSHFSSVFSIFFFVLKRLGRDTWSGEVPELPSTIFDAIKDNPEYIRLLTSSTDSASSRPALSWMSTYLDHIGDDVVHGKVLAHVMNFLCEDLQRDQFGDVRQSAMSTATQLVLRLLKKYPSQQLSFQQYQALSLSIENHSGRLASIAFSRKYDDVKWKAARDDAREIIFHILMHDTDEVLSHIIPICRYAAGKEVTIKSPSHHASVWKNTHKHLQSNDMDAVARLISVVAKIALLDDLNPKAFGNALPPNNVRPGAKAMKEAFEKTNQYLRVMRSGFLETLSNCANFNQPNALLDLFQHPDLVTNIIILMISPIDDFEEAVKSLVTSAFDVDSRQECFRVLLVKMPVSALEGVFQFLSKFITYAERTPEACSSSKSLVRCLTDIIEVFCASSGGLLHDSHFLRPSDEKGPAGQMLKLWSLMADAIKLIFRRTPSWAPYFENADMIVWMRDALIFGRDMLAQRRTIEMAAASLSSGPDAKTNSTAAERSRRLSPLGRKMVNQLQDVLPEMARWLRLTDEELLYQSFSLLMTLLECFKETGIAPGAEGMSKLESFISGGLSGRKSQTRLDMGRLTELRGMLVYFQDDDDDIEIISHTKSSTDQASTSKIEPKVERKPSTFKPDGSKQLSLSRFVGKDERKPITSFKEPPVRPPAPVQRVSSSVSVKTSVRGMTIKNEGASAAAQQPVESSSSESESDSEDEQQSQGPLAALGKMQKSPKIKKQAERRQVKMLDLPNMASNSMQNRINQREDARRTALRLKPDVSGLHNALLSWEYNHDGPMPPEFNMDVISVPDTFNTFEHYIRVFEPLFLLECWAQVCQSKEEQQDPYLCKIASRQWSDHYIDMDFTIPGSVERGWHLADTDVVLLSQPDNGKNIIAKVTSYRAGRPAGIQGGLRCMLGSRPDPGLQTNTSWNIKKILSLSTVHREYSALLGLQYYGLLSTILRPQLSKTVVNDSTQVQRAMTRYKVNEPQAIAILSSMKTEGFSLIQGPPGTGKTSTICGLVEAFLATRRKPAVAIGASKPSEPTPPQKILICAPSNAAIDELANRIKERYGKASASPNPVNVVRVGALSAINISVKDIALDTLVDQKLDATKSETKNDADNEINELRAEISTVRELKQKKQEELGAVRGDSQRSLALENEIKSVNARRMNLTQRLDRLKDKQKADSRSLDAARRKYRAEVMFEADIICGTLAGAGHELLGAFDYEMVVIDEAAQAVELSSLIPLKYNCKRCIMVGDPQQLPPTVISQKATQYMYNQSLFVRMQKQRPDAVHLLSIQYRMHPDISKLPSRVFYSGKLQDGPDMDVKTKQVWHSHEKFGTYRFFNVKSGQEEQRSHSLTNRAETEMAVALYTRLTAEFKGTDFDYRIGVVSMYRAQIQELRRAFEQRFGRDILGTIDFNTVDGFQGQEKDIIILSCVRAGPGVQSIGFLSDTRRMNVAITRARSSLYILGNAATLERSDETWRHIVQDAKSRNTLVDVDLSYFASGGSRRITAPRPTQTATGSKGAASSTKGYTPNDLVTPQGLKATEKLRAVDDQIEARMLVDPPSDPVVQEPAEKAKPTLSTQAKRTVDQMENAGSTSNSSQDVRRPQGKDRPPQAKPPAKRQKQAPSLFIPKKRPGA